MPDNHDFSKVVQSLAKAAAALNPLSPPDPIVLQVGCWNIELVISRRHEAVPPSRPAQDTRPVEETILEAIGTDTLPMRKIAERSGYSYSGHLKDAVAKLVREHRLEKTLDGFRTPILPV